MSESLSAAPDIERIADLAVALERLIRAVASENFNRPARAPEMTRSLRSALENARRALEGRRA